MTAPGVGVGVVRWTFTALSGPAETYTFEINPNAQTSPLPARDVAWHGGPGSGGAFAGIRAPATPHPYEFSGVLRSQAQYDALLRWVGKRVKIAVVTDLGQRLVLRLVAFKPTQERHRPAAPYRHTYAVTALLLPR